MTIETLVTAVSVLAGLGSLSAVVYDLRSRKSTPDPDRRITITIEDSSGARARTVTHSDRGVDELKRLLDRILAQPS
jgi:hypothetical protein